MKLFVVDKYGTSFTVFSTYHGNTVREGEARARMKFFTEKKLKSILSAAAKSISQYRNKGRVAITFLTSSGRTGALLVALEGNELTIITTLYNVKRNVNDVFYGVPHYYLQGYVFTKPTDKELRAEFHLQRDKYTSKEDKSSSQAQNKQFRKNAGNVSKPKWKN